MAPVLSFLISSGSKKKESRYTRLREAKASFRLKILMTSGFKKGTQLYSVHFLQKSRQTNRLQVPQEGSYREGGTPIGHFAYNSPLTVPDSSSHFSSRVSISSVSISYASPYLLSLPTQYTARCKPSACPLAFQFNIVHSCLYTLLHYTINYPRYQQILCKV